jgi:hypothetical protein
MANWLWLAFLAWCLFALWVCWLLEADHKS